MSSVEGSRVELFSPGERSRSQSSPPKQEGTPQQTYSFPSTSNNQQSPSTPPVIHRRLTYQPLGGDHQDPPPLQSPHRFTHPDEPDRPLSRHEPTYDPTRPQHYFDDPAPYEFPYSGGSIGGAVPGRSSAAASFDQLRHSIAAAQHDVSDDYSGLGRQVVMSGGGRLEADYNDYEEVVSPQSYHQSHYYNHQPTYSYDRPTFQPAHLHPLQQQAPPAYIYGQPTHRHMYDHPEEYSHVGGDNGWGEGQEVHSPQSTETPNSVWPNSNSDQQIPMHLLPPLPPLPPLTQPAVAPPPPLRPSLYGSTYPGYTPYSIPLPPTHGSVGGRDGWGPPPAHSSHYPPLNPHRPDDQPYLPIGSNEAEGDYIDPNVYAGYESGHLTALRYVNPPIKQELDVPTSSSTKKPAKPRSRGGPPKPRTKSVIYHPSPQAMLAPEIRQMVEASALIPRGSHENTPHIGTNAPALPDEKTMKSMMTKRSRGRRPPAQAELIDNFDLEDPNLHPSQAQIDYCGLTKTGKPKKIFLCKVPECGKCFKRSEHLKRHVRSIHTNEKPFQCQWPGCANYFSRHDNLNQHLRVHRSPNQSDASFSAQLEACFGAYHHAHGFHPDDLRRQNYDLDDIEVESG